MSAFLGLDIGTSGVKAIIVEDRDRELATASAPLHVDRPRPLWSEQSPASWWDASAAALDELAAKYPKEMSGVEAIGLSGQMLGVTLLDAKDEPIRPALLWNDGRAEDECAWLCERIPDFVATTGCKPMPGFSAPKILWLSRHEREAVARTRRILLTKDYVRLCLTGEAVSDLADASATLLMDTKAARWSPDIVSACGISIEALPRLADSGVAAGNLRAGLSRRWNLRSNITIGGGAGDNMCGAVGANVVSKGDAYISLGTSGVYFVANDRFVPSQDRGMHTHRHALPTLFAQHGCVLSAASALSWLANILSVDSIDRFLGEIEKTDVGSAQIPVFSPYLGGERTPHNDPHATASFSGLSFATSRQHLGRAVLDGVAFAIADCDEALRSAGAPVERIALIGGGARSRFWGEIIATVLERPLRLPEKAAFGPAFGAARLARKSVGGALIADQGREADIEPRGDWIEGYRARRAIYRAHYPALGRIQ